jgi:hypothetical protein
MLPLFHALLSQLKSAARFFYTALDAGFNTEKGAFYAFLGSLEMPSIHAQLTHAVDPVLLKEKNPDVSQSEIRHAGLRTVEEALREITEEHRTVMYYNARTLFCLKELSVFTFDRILMAFVNDASKNCQTCSVSIIKEMLITLNNILYSLKTIPSMTLLESLFIFLLQERSGEPDFDINKEIRKLLIKAEDALRVIRDFNKQVPLTKIIRCSNRNSPVQLREISGGEDWYSVYRDHWKRLVEDNIAAHFFNRREKELFVSFGKFLNGAEFKVLNNVESETNRDGFPIKGVLGLSFLLNFYSVVFLPNLNDILKTIMIDGEFSRKENRKEFNESYNDLIKLDDIIHKLETEIGSSGDYGQRYIQAKQELCALTIKHRKVQIILDEASAEALKIIEDARRSIVSITYLLEGIVGMDTFGQYFPLTNITKLSEKNVGFISGVNEAIEKFRKTFDLMNEIDNLDMG